MPKEKNTAYLSIYLVKEEFKRRDKIIKEDECKEPITVPISGSGKSYLYIKQTPGKYPKWSSLFSELINPSQIGKTSNIAAAFLIKVSGRYFILAFGQGGRFLIKDDVCEERFGLLVALNSIDKESLRCIDKQSLDTLESHTRIQSGHETTADQFGIDVEQDMLRAVVGTPINDKLGSRMTGTDSLSVSVAMELSDLPFLLKEYKEKYEKDLSSTDYQWVNNISIVKSTSVINTLEGLLQDKFKNKDYKNLWLSIPELIEWNLVKGFIYTNGRNIIYPDINLDSFLKTVKDDQDITLDLLKQRHVYCADTDHKKIFNSWSIYKCVYVEIDKENEKYLFNGGKWYKIQNDFVDRTNKDFNKIEYSSLSLPDFSGGGEEGYNKSVADNQKTKFALLDKKIIFHGGGHGQIEVCDLFSTEKHLIHIKIYSSSSILSHLFSQGYVSGRLLQLDTEFRNKVKGKLNAPFNSLIKVDRRPNDKEYTIVYAIISEEEGDKLHLPFFSRVNLNNIYKTLKGYGYNVELLKIDVDKTYAVTTKIPAKKKRK